MKNKKFLEDDENAFVVKKKGNSKKASTETEDNKSNTK
jgi:hypothetical protein